MTGARMIVLATFPSRLAAEIAVTYLESDGIPASIEVDDFGGQNPALQLTRGTRVLVEEGMKNRAQQLLDAGGALDPGELLAKPSASTSRTYVYVLTLMLLFFIWLLWQIFKDLS